MNQETNEFASRMETEVAQRAKKLRTENRPELDSDHPVNESVQHTLDRTNSEIEAIQTELSDWQQLVAKMPPLQATTEEASRLIDRQRNVEADVADAGEDVLRAGRHEQRLEKAEIAEAVQQVAEAITQEGVPAAEEANRSLQRASKDAAQTPSANDDLQAAAEEIDRTAGLLQELLVRPASCCRFIPQPC